MDKWTNASSVLGRITNERMTNIDGDVINLKICINI